MGKKNISREQEIPTEESEGTSTNINHTKSRVIGEGHRTLEERNRLNNRSTDRSHLKGCQETTTLSGICQVLINADSAPQQTIYADTKRTKVFAWKQHTSFHKYKKRIIEAGNA